jgi:hypothetical protein
MQEGRLEHSGSVAGAVLLLNTVIAGVAGLYATCRSVPVTLAGVGFAVALTAWHLWTERLPPVSASEDRIGDGVTAAAGSRRPLTARAPGVWTYPAGRYRYASLQPRTSRHIPVVRGLLAQFHRAGQHLDLLGYGESAVGIRCPQRLRRASRDQGAWPRATRRRIRPSRSARR